MKKRLKIFAAIAAGTILLTLLGVFVFREEIISSQLDKYIQRFEAKYDVLITYNELSYNGVSEIDIEGFNITQKEDTLARVDTIQVTFPFWKTLFGGRKLDELKIANAELFPFKYKSPAPADTVTQKPENTSSRVEKLKSLIVKAKRALPDAVAITNITTYANGKAGINKYAIDTLSYFDNQLVLISNIVDEENQIQPFDWLGLNNTDAEELGFEYVAEQPFNLKVRKGNLGFTKCAFTVKLNASDDVKMEVQASVDSAKVYHYRIAERPILISNCAGKFGLDITDNAIKAYTIDSVNVVNGLQYIADASYAFRESKQIEINLQTRKQPAQEYVDAVPKIFRIIDRLKVEGELSYKLHFKVDMAQVDSLEFESELTGYNFKLLNAGKVGLTIMNDTFIHVVKTENAVYRIGVGEGMENFTPINEVPRHLIDAILTSEDPSFFRHRGFIESAVRESIITNIKERRFKRGGSTISMQLVKNLFLSKEKTLTRKIEEIALVWILENKRITTKERMFEVYLNIIEWGPGIYGIHQAAEFYFNKKPHQLSLEESLYLASIIPRPKSFKYAFDKEGNIKPHYVEQFRFIKNLMVKRELISPMDTLGFNPDIKLKGEAKYQVSPQQEKLIDKVEGFFDNLF